jgi:hypothetical protein
MSVKTSEARQLCTKSELGLYLASLPRAVKKLKAAALRSKITRSRRLRDKYRQLADRQTRESRGKQAARGKRPASGNQRTRRKEQMFAEVLERFQTRLALAGKPLTPAKKKTAIKKTPKKKVVVRKTTKKKTAKKTTTAKKKEAKPVRKQTIATVASAPRSTAKRSKTKAQSAGSRVEVETAAKRSRLAGSGTQRIQRHIAAEGRRRQARRDSR